VEASYADIQDISTESHQIHTVRKLFVHVEMPAFSNVHVYVIACTQEKEKWNKSGVILSRKAIQHSFQHSHSMKNNNLKIQIGKDGKLMKMNNFKNGIKSGLRESFTAFGFSHTQYFVKYLILF